MEKTVKIGGINYTAEIGESSYRIPHAVNRTAKRGNDGRWRVIEGDENNRNRHVTKMTNFEKQYIQAFAEA